MTHRSLLWRWTACSVVGLVVGLPAGLLLGGPIEALLGAMFVTPLAFAVSGLVLGSSQWLVLRHHFARAGWWIVCTAVGLGIGATSGVVSVEIIGEALTGEQVRISSVGPLARVASFGLIGCTTGLALGAVQFLFLRRFRSRSRRWLLFSVVGTTLGFVLASATTELLPSGSISLQGGILLLVMASAIAGAITARGMAQVVTAPSRRHAVLEP